MKKKIENRRHIRFMPVLWLDPSTLTRSVVMCTISTGSCHERDLGAIEEHVSERE